MNAKPFSAALLVLLLCALTARGEQPNPQTNLLLSKWSFGGGAPDKTDVKLTQTPSLLTVEVVNKNNNLSETSPNLTCSFGGARDWRNYSQLKCRMRLTTDLAPMQEDGKQLCFCFYDQDMVHEISDVTVQQSIPKRLMAGDWQDVTIDLSLLRRAKAQSMDIYLYIQPYGVNHTFKIEISRMELVGGDDDHPNFDGWVLNAPLAGASAGTGQRLAAPDGFGLALAGNGGVPSIFMGDKELGNPGQPGGLMVRPAAGDAPPVVAGGRVQAEAGGLAQSADLPDQSLHLDGHYLVEGNRLHVTLHAANTGKESRSFTLYYALPLKPGDWKWSDGIRESMAMPAAAGAANWHEEITNLSPLATMASADGAIALAVPLDKPQTYRIGFNDKTGLFYVAYDLTLVDAKNPQSGASLNEATCDFYLYACDPAWGYRDALQKYYAAFPDWFTQRVKGGGWDLESGRKGLKDEDIVTSGCRFFWGILANQWAKWNAAHGTVSLAYIEPSYVQISMTDLLPSTTAGLERLQKLSEKDPAEWAKIKSLHYTTSGIDHAYAQTKGMEAYHDYLAQGAYHSFIYTAWDKPDLGVGYRPGWIGENGLGMMVPCNLDPDIPDGRGQAAMAFLEEDAKMVEAKTGAHVGGWALDSYICDDTEDYRAENFPYSPFPIGFDRDNRKPSVLQRLTMAAWIKALAERSRPANRVILPNEAQNLTYSAPYTDIFGSESGFVPFPDYQRAMAYHRAVTYLPYSPKPDGETFFNLLYGIYPGRGLTMAAYNAVVPLLDKLDAAGWEPVTYARADMAKVRVERFGSGDNCYFAFFNPDRTAVRFHVTVDADALKSSFDKATVLFGPQKGRIVSKGTKGDISLNLGPRETALIKLGEEAAAPSADAPPS
jgi:hypothetical protein